MVFAWSMQFIVIEWQVYSITKDPFLRYYRTNGSYPCCFYGFVCWPHSGSERKGLLVKCILAFSVISFGLFYWHGGGRAGLLATNDFIFYLLLSFSWISSGFLRTNYLFTIIHSFLKKVYPNAATWSSSVWQIANVMGPAFAGFSITLIGVHWSMYRFVCSFLHCWFYHK
jgi:hypothetical protein